MLDEEESGVEEFTDGFVLPPSFPMLAEGDDARVLLVAVEGEEGLRAEQFGDGAEAWEVGV